MSTLQQLVVRNELATQEQVREAMWATQLTAHDWIDELMVRGILDEERYIDCVVRTHYVPRADLRRLAQVSVDALAIIPPDLAAEHRIVPLWLEADGDLRVVVADPTDRRGIEEVQFFAGCRLLREVAPPTAVAWALHRYYDVPSILVPDTMAAAATVVTAVADYASYAIAA